ncbi:MAG: TraR/DksA family transcriptional regulator [Chloroflexota bacterium]
MTLQESTRDMLLRERAAVLARMDVVTRDALDVELETDGIPPSSYEREHAIKSMLDGRLAEIDDALDTIGTGTYGICADCHQEIPAKRLQAQPFATLCVSCQSVADKRARNHALRS